MAEPGDRVLPQDVRGAVRLRGAGVATEHVLGADVDLLQHQGVLGLAARGARLESA